MTHEEREIHRTKRILEHAERMGNINTTWRYFGVARSTTTYGETGIASSVRRGSEARDLSVGRLRPPHVAGSGRAGVVTLHTSGARVPVSMGLVEHDVGWRFNPGFDRDFERHLGDDRVGRQRDVVPAVKSPHDLLLPETRGVRASSQAYVTLPHLVPPVNPSSVGKATNVVVLHYGIVRARHQQPGMLRCSTRGGVALRGGFEPAEG